MKMVPESMPYTRLGHECRYREIGMARAVDAVTRYTAVMMVRDWLTGGRLTLLVSPARYVPYTSRPAYSTGQECGSIIYHGK